MATVNIENVGLYLSARYGNRDDYKMVLHIYETTAVVGKGLPAVEGVPLGTAERSVDGVDHEGWYVFNFETPVSVESGTSTHYSLVLFLVPDDVADPPDFDINFVDWFHTKSKSLKTSIAGDPLHSFSSDLGFGSEEDTQRFYSYGYTDGVSIFDSGYGYAVAGSLPSQYNYFDVIGFNGLEAGKSFTGVVGDYAYDQGWEMGNFVSTQRIERNYKLYGSFNDIQFITNTGNEDIDRDYVQINLPPATEESESFDNRQDFVQATKNGSDVIGKYLTLSESGERLYSSDISLFDRNGNFSSVADINWYESNLFLSVNDLNDIDIVNTSGNTNAYGALMVAAPYYSGVYYSVNGGSTWTEKTYNLTLNDDFRNIQAVVFDPDADYIMAIDYTNVSEASKTYVLDIAGGTSWSYQGQMGAGVIVNSIIGVGGDEFWAGTNAGIYKTVNKGVTWTTVNTGLDALTEVRQIQEQTNGSGIYVIATSTGTYAYNSTTSAWVKVHTASSYSVHMNTRHFYIGTATYLLRNIDDDLTGIFGAGLNFEGSSSSNTNYYAFGLLKQRITGILSRDSVESEIYVSQNGGIFVSKNDGGNFTNLSNKLYEKKVNKIISNPVNNRVLYAVVETVKFSRAGMTIMLDTSGSSFSNDPEGRRIDFLSDVIDGIEAQAQAEGNSAYYQLITFGVSEEQARRIGNLSDEKDFPGVTNETGGYTSNSEFVKTKLETFRTIGRHFRTPLNEALDITSESLEKFASSWRYDDRNNVYEFNEIVSQYFNELDRFVLLVTDGMNSVLGKTLTEVIGDNSYFSKMRGLFYVIGLGHNIDYESLKEIKDAHQFGKLYTPAYKENISNEEGDSDFSDISEVILERERYRKRTGTWDKIIHYTEPRRMEEVEFSASIPPGTSVSLKVRSSMDKNNWTDWIGPLDENVSNTVGLYGKHFEFYIVLESNSTRYSPEIKYINYITLEPKESVILYKVQDLPNSNRIDEITISTMDDTSLGRISTEDVDTQYGVLQSDSTDFNFFKEINRDLRNVVNRKEYEELTTIDGYYFNTERGSWPSDADIDVYDISDGVSEVDDVINDSLYYTVPERGLVVFYNKVDSTKTYAIRINFDDSVYRVGMKATNYTDANQLYRMHNIGWMFLDDQDSFLTNRAALPYVGSQLGVSEVYGFATPQFPYSNSSISNVISLQYINKDSYSGGTISITHGNKIDISTGSSSVIRFYDQNFGLSTMQVSDPGSTGYVTVSSSKATSVPVISDTDTISFKQQIDISVSSLNIGESLPVIIGDISGGGDGLPSTITMNNLLFEQSNSIECEYETTFLIGESSTNDPVSTEDSPATFIKPLSPNLKFGGNTDISLRVIAPTTVQAGTSFTYIVLVVDSNGFINRNTTASVSMEISNSSATISTTSYTFTLNDVGKKKFTGIVNVGATSYFTVNVTLNGTVYESNPIVTVYDKKVKWGDLNVSTVFSEGRQDIDFAVDYAQNTSLIDFIGFADDLSMLDQQEFDYTRYKATLESTGSFVALAGFRYRVENSHGERVVLFSNAYDSGETVTIFTDPYDLDGEQAQIRSLADRLEGDSIDFNYVSMPIHTPYAPNSSREEIFDRRSFNFENYRYILGYGSSQIQTINIENFVNNESIVEIYSDHGNTEYNDIPDELNTYDNSNFYDNSTLYYIRTALRIGKRFGFVANAGNYGTRPGYYSGEETTYVDNRPAGQNYNRGLTAVRIDNMSPDNLINTLRNRSTYATTGARIYLQFYGSTTKNGSSVTANMGEVIYDLERTGSRDELALYPNNIYIRAIGDKSNIVRILLYRIKVDGNIEELLLDSLDTDLEDFNTTDFGRDTGLLTYTDSEIQSLDVLNQEYVYYVKVIQNDGHFGWGSPLYFNYGRTSGVRSQSSISDSYVFGPSVVGTPSDIQGIPLVLGGSSVQFPQAHKNILVNPNSLIPRSLVRETPYSNRFLYAGNVQPLVTGIRVLLENNKFIAYGSHYARFVLSESDSSNDINTNLNLNDMNPSGNNVDYDYLNSDEITRTREKYYRSYLFSTLFIPSVTNRTKRSSSLKY